MQNEITELRNQVRTLKRIVYGFGCLLVVGVVVGATSLQTVPDVIQAKRFEVLGEDGNAVVVLDCYLQENEKEIPFSGEVSVIREKNYLGFIRTQNSKGQILAEFTATVDGEGVVEIQNGKGQTLVELGTTVNGEGMVTTKNGKGQPLVQLGATVVGEGVIRTRNGKGQTLVELGATVDGQGMVTTQNGKGQTLVKLGVSVAGEGTVTTENGKGQTLVRLGIYSGLQGGYVETFTQSGVSTSEIP